MIEHKELYPYSRAEAQRNNEMDGWLESYRENCICAREIEKAIAEGYSYENSVLNKERATDVIVRYGFDRVNWVLANTIQEGIHDGRYSEKNKAWARSFSIPRDADFPNYTFAVTSHPGLVDIFTNLARQAWVELGLFDSTHCYAEPMNYTGKVVVLRPQILKDKYKTPEDQLFYAQGGNGCKPDALGTKVFGQCLKDGEETYYRRGDIIGVLKLDFIPDWANEKLAEITNKSKNPIIENQEPAQESSGMGEIK